MRVPTCGTVATPFTAPADGSYTFQYTFLGVDYTTPAQVVEAGDALTLNGTLFNETARLTGTFYDATGQPVTDGEGRSVLSVTVAKTVQL